MSEVVASALCGFHQGAPVSVWCACSLNVWQASVCMLGWSVRQPEIACATGTHIQPLVLTSAIKRHCKKTNATGLQSMELGFAVPLLASMRNNLNGSNCATRLQSSAKAMIMPKTQL